MVRVSSPPQSRSKAVVCVSTPRMYPQSGYFLVYNHFANFSTCMFIWSYTFIDFGIIFLPTRLFGLHVYLALQSNFLKSVGKWNVEICYSQKIAPLKCNNLQTAPSSRWASVGGLLNGKPLICGGFNGTHSFQDCFFVHGNINQNISMTQIRSFATAVVLQGKALMNP